MKKRFIKKSASITVEASLCFPLFFFGILALCFLFVFLRVEYLFERGMYQSARNISQYGMVIKPLTNGLSDILDIKQTDDKKSGESENAVKNIVDQIQEIAGLNFLEIIAGRLDDLAVRELVEEYIPDEAYKYISDAGVSYEGSVLFDSDECIRICCGYELKLPFDFFSVASVKIKQEVKYRYFTGTETKSLLNLVEEIVPSPVPTPGPDPPVEAILTPTPIPDNSPTPTETDEIVLITETGYVYHRTYSCPNLKVKPVLVYFSTVSSKRNESGGKYYPCEHCVKGNLSLFECYITPDGDRYHSKKDCSGLKRTIFEVHLSEVGNRRECKRCRKK